MNLVITGDVVSSAGSRSASAAYVVDDNLGEVGGVAMATNATTSARHGFIGQLYEVVGLEVFALPNTVAEGSTRLLAARSVLDDGTQLTLLASEVTWTVLSGPLVGVNAFGLASAGTVYSTSEALVQGAWSTFTDTLALQVQNVLPDNFGSYAADGLPDHWQVQHFGLDHPQAGPLMDLDQDGLHHLMEYAFNLNPHTDSSAQLPAVQRLGNDFVLSFPTPIGVSGISYGVEWSTTLLPNSWTSITNTGISPLNYFSVPLGSHEKLFLRLKVSAP